MTSCQGKEEKVIQIWREALTHVANIEEEHSLNWANEAEMIQKIAIDVLKKLYTTPSMDFEGLVGMEAHLSRLNTLLCLESPEVKMVGIWGPSGIGKSTIARALFVHLSSSFPLRCFMENLRGSPISILGLYSYDSKLGLQSRLLSTIFNQREIKVQHLGAVKERLKDQRVLIVLDDVDDRQQLEILAREPSWFGNGSRIIVTTLGKKILKAPETNDIYRVDYPCVDEALEIFCLAAFKQKTVPYGFEEIAEKITWRCGNLPLALSVVGSSLSGESKDEWELQLTKMEASLDRKIENVLRMGYDRLSKKDQSLFLHIACFFNGFPQRSIYNDVDYVTAMLADSNLDVENGLKTLDIKSLLDKFNYRSSIKMHTLLEQLGRQIVHEESTEPGKRQFLVENEEILHVLRTGAGSGSIIGIRYFAENYKEKFSVKGRAFEGMTNLRFLRISGILEISEDLKYLPCLRLLHWEYCPTKRLPPTFQPECLVELCMYKSKLKWLWKGIKRLPNLKTIDLTCSYKLEEIPNLSKAKNLETLNFGMCVSLKELPSSIKNLQKLKKADLRGCTKLRVIPTNIDLASLEEVNVDGCSQLTTFPDFSSNVKRLHLGGTKIEDVHVSVVGSWLCLNELCIGSRSLKELTHVPKCVRRLDLSCSDIKRIPDCVFGLPHLEVLTIRNCMKLVSLPSLPSSLYILDASGCISLESICLEKEVMTTVNFNNCLKLDEEARRSIIHRWVYNDALLPGKEIPENFTHKAKGNSITISEETLPVSSRFKACLLIPPSSSSFAYDFVDCRLINNRGFLINELMFQTSSPGGCDRLTSEGLLTEHLLVISGDIFQENICLEEIIGDIEFEFIFTNKDYKIMECGVQILKEEGECSSGSQWKELTDGPVPVSKNENVVKNSKHTSWWNRFKKFDLKNFCGAKSRKGFSVHQQNICPVDRKAS